METWIHWSFSCAFPDTLLVLVEHSATVTAETEADDYRLSLRSVDAEASIALRVNLRILLTWLVEAVWHEIFLDDSIIDSNVELLDSVVGSLLLEVLVEEKRIVGSTYPRVLIRYIPESHRVDDILVLA